MASSTELLMILGIYVLIASTAITFIVNGNSQIAFGEVTNGGTYNNLLLNANLSDFGFVPLKGTWAIDNFNGLHATGLTDYTLALSYVYDIDGNFTDYAEINLNNVNVSNNISETYTLKNYVSKASTSDSGVGYTYFASWINDVTNLFLFGDNFYFVVENNKVFIADRTTYVGYDTGVKKHFFNYDLPNNGNITVGYYYHYDTKNIDLYVNGVKVDTINVDMGIPSNPIKMRKVLTNSKLLGITSIGTSITANVVVTESSSASWLQTFAFILLWNVNEQFLPLWCNIIFIKLPLIIIGWIIARFFWGD